MIMITLGLIHEENGLMRLEYSFITYSSDPSLFYDEMCNETEQDIPGYSGNQFIRRFSFSNLDILN